MSPSTEHKIVIASTGVKFRLKQPNIWAITEVQEQHAALTPKPPRVMIEAKGREEENPSDPDYQNALIAHTAKGMTKIHDIIMATGVEVIKVPDSVMSLVAFDAEGGCDLMKLIKVPLAETKTERFIQWIKYVAAPEASDMRKMMSILLPMVGTKEEDVAKAAQSFPDNPPGGSDNGAGSPEVGQHRNRVRKPAARASPAL